MSHTRLYLIAITLVASLGGFLFVRHGRYLGRVALLQKQLSLTAVQEGWFVSSALVGYRS